MARLWTYTTSSGEERNLVTLLECGELYEYTVPSFPVISVELRRMKYESIMPDGKSTKVVDGFIREDASLKRSFPADITIGEGYRHACIVPVSFARWPYDRWLGIKCTLMYLANITELLGCLHCPTHADVKQMLLPFVAGERI